MSLVLTALFAAVSFGVISYLLALQRENRILNSYLLALQRENRILKVDLEFERERSERYHERALEWAETANKTCDDWMAEVEDIRRHNGLFPAERS